MYMRVQFFCVDVLDGVGLLFSIGLCAVFFQLQERSVVSDGEGGRGLMEDFRTTWEYPLAYVLGVLVSPFKNPRLV